MPAFIIQAAQWKLISGGGCDGPGQGGINCQGGNNGHGQGGNDFHTSLGGNDHHDHGSNDDFLIIRVMLVLIC